MQKHQAFELCRKHLYRYVEVETKDGRRMDGIIENVDNDNLYLAVPRGGGCRKSEEGGRQFFPGYGYGFGYPGFGFGYPGFGYPFYGYGRFRRFILPLTLLAGLTLLPYY